MTNKLKTLSTPTAEAPKPTRMDQESLSAFDQWWDSCYARNGSNIDLKTLAQAAWSAGQSKGWEDCF